MKKSIVTSLFALFLLITFIATANGQDFSPIRETEYFEFHSNYWVNYHHFLYQKAQGSQQKKLNEDGFEFLKTAELHVYQELNPNEKIQLESAIKFYKDSIINKSLERQLSYLLSSFQKQKDYSLQSDSIFSEYLIKMLNETSGIYEKHFWPIHKKQNADILELHLPTISQIEKNVVSKMEQLSSNSWPTEERVRIDLTTYANWAGGYTATRPKFNIVISTIDPSTESTAFIETVFHEGSHLLFRFGSPFRSLIYNTSERINKTFPKGLWHACLFYLCGKVVEFELKEMGVQHNLNMISKNIFSDYSNAKFKKTMNDYLAGQKSIEDSVKELVVDLK